MYSWGDDTSDWAKPGTYAYSESTKAVRDEDAKKAKASGPRAYTDRGGPNEQLTNPKKVVTTTSPNPLIIGVDVTGSMQRWPFEIFDRLPLLYQTLSQYRPDLEVCFVAIGDTRCDRWPMQCTTFAKGFELDQNLKALHGEGGGGDAPESYGVFAQWVNTHVHADNAERPFLIVFGDAPMHDKVMEGEVRHVLGDEIPQALDATTVWHQVSRKWNTWFLRRPGGTKGDATDKQWASAIGAQQIVHMDDEQRAVDYALGLIARSWGHFEDFKVNMNARQDEGKVKSIASRLDAVERAIDAAKAPRVMDCPRCGAPLADAKGKAAIECNFCAARIEIPLRR